MYPDRYTPQTNFPREEQLTEEISTTALQAEFQRIAESISQIITLARRITTSDGRLKLDQAVRIMDTVTEVAIGTGDGVTTVFPLPAEIDAAVDLLRTFVSGVRTDPLSYNDTSVTFAVAPAGGAPITGLVYTNIAGVLDRMQSVVADEGASLIGIADSLGLFSASNVEDALAELAQDLDSLLTALGDIGGYVLRDGSRTLTGQWELNDRTSVTIPPAAAVGTFRINANPADGDYVEIDDGVLTTRFEYDNNAAVTAGAVSVAIGLSAAESATNIAAAINGSPLAVKAEVSGQNVALTHEIPYALGNQPIVTSGAAITSVTGMAGGVDGSFSAAYMTHYRVRNSPRSLRDGDVVVHEQLQDVYTQLNSMLTSFLRTDGANQMTGNLNLGGNKAVNAANATVASDLLPLGQAETLIATAGDSKLSLIGTKDTPAEGTLTGPVSLNRVYTETADADQTTTPSSVVVNTIHSVPKPGALGHVANKAYVDESIAALSTGDPNTLPDFDMEGDGLGGGGLANINNGGEFYFANLTIAAAQSIVAPARIYVSGNLDLQNTGSITSTSPVEIIVTGNVTLAGAITCPYFQLIAGGTVSITAAITTETLGSYHYRYSDKVPAAKGGPVDTVGDPAGTFPNGPSIAEIFRAIIIDAAGTVTISANLTSDDILIKSLGSITVSSTLRARWWLRSLPGDGTYSTTGNFYDANYRPICWRDTVRKYLAVDVVTGSITDHVGGSGGTAGGNGGKNGGTPVPAGASVFNGTNRPHLLPTYELARGSHGGGGYSGNQSKAGGRISIYADGDIVATAAQFNADGENAADTPNGDAGGGGAGVVRIVCKGTLTDGALTAVGGTAGGFGAGAGGGGLAATLASAYAGVQSRTAAAGTGGSTPATAGTTVTSTKTAAEIEGLKDRGTFDVLHG